VLIKSGGSLVLRLYAADKRWFAERRIKARNIASSANRLSPPQGLNEVARILANGTITAPAHSTVDLDGAGQMLEKAPQRRLSAARPTPVLSSAGDEIPVPRLRRQPANDANLWPRRCSTMLGR
jgi:hypothetical protein